VNAFDEGGAIQHLISLILSAPDDLSPVIQMRTIDEETEA
jgi:hypothetical protein